MLSIHSYGDDEYQLYENNINETKRVTFEDLIETIHGKRRVRRAAIGDSTTVTSEITTESLNSINSSAIYIIAGYSSSDVTTEVTTYIVPTSQGTSFYYNGTFIITGVNQITTSTTSTTTVSGSTSSNICNNGTHIIQNGVCISRESLINSSISILNSTSANDTQKADALTTYLTAITNSNITSNSTTILPLNQIDQILGNLSVNSYNISTNDSIIVITRPRPCENVVSIIGASFDNNTAEVINTNNKNNITNSNLSAAGIVNFTAQCTVNRFNILIINNPTTYQITDNSSNEELVSSIIMATIGTTNSVIVNLTIELYFQPKKSQYSISIDEYICAFYDATTSKWNSSGCLPPIYNQQFNRFECNCSHLTSFALIWRPKFPPGHNNNTRPEYDAQDIVSIIFQVFSILCFVGIVIHGIIVSRADPQNMTEPQHLLPLISYAATSLLFIFYIILGATVYTRFKNGYPTNTIQSPNSSGSSSNGNPDIRSIQTGFNSRADVSIPNSSESLIPCLSNEHGLMFTVYFLIIFMFCTKTSIGFDNYRRYVKLFPPPSYRMLSILMIISFIISSIWVAFAAGFNSKSSYEISEVVEGKLCWFRRQANHYFLTIPISIFLAVNLGMFALVVKHSLAHVHDADEHITYCHRRAKCVYILVISAATQGFGWLFGLVIGFANENAAEGLAWLFIICNGLEGFWALLLYILLKKKDMDVPKRKAYQRKSSLDDIDNKKTIDDNDIELTDKPRPLSQAISDSPRNSFIDYVDSQILRRSYQTDNIY